MAAVQSLTQLAQWTSLWEEIRKSTSGSVLIFKRSPTCPISHAAEERFHRTVSKLADDTGLRIYSVDVVAQRPVSQRIASDTGVTHESPQALLLGPGGAIVWHESHDGIDAESLSAHLPASKKAP